MKDVKGYEDGKNKKSIKKMKKNKKREEEEDEEAPVACPQQPSSCASPSNWSATPSSLPSSSC